MRKIYLLLLMCCLVHAASAFADFSPGKKKRAENIIFASDVIQPADVSVCNGANTGIIAFTSNFPGTTFSWVNNTTSIGLASSGTGNIASFVASNNGTTPVVATITVTPSDGVSNGTPRSFIITVNPSPTVNPVSSQVVCNNTSTGPINFSGAVAGTNYTWINPDPSIGLAASGTGNIPSFIATNASTAVVSATISVTPVFGGTAPELLYYKFNGAGNSVPNLASNPPAGTATATIVGNYTQGGAGICGGSLQSSGNFINDYMDTHWVPSLNGSWTISFIVSGFSNSPTATTYNVFGSTNFTSPFFCRYVTPQPGGNGLGAFELFTSSGVPLVEGDFTTPKTVTFSYNHSNGLLTTYLNGIAQNSLVGNYTINTSAFYIGNVHFGTSGSPSAGSSIDEFRLYNRLLSPSEIAALANSCSASDACAGLTETFSITVFPTPTVNAVANQEVCNNTTTNAINFTGNMGATYNWTNSDPSIGLAANGTGDIPSFTAINTGNSVVTATITVTPVVSGPPVCSGTPETFTITVYPVPAATATPASQTLCSDGAIQDIIMSGNVPGATYTWTRDMLTEVTGIPASGTGTIAGSVSNTTTTQVTVTFTIIPSIGSCTGTPITATITVDPVPVATTSPASQTICSGPITDIIHSSNMSGSLFSWTRDNTVDVTGMPASGTGDISGSLINNTNSPVTVTFTITPSINGCSGQAIFATVLVNAAPTIVCPSNITLSNTTGMCGTIPTYVTTVTGAPAPDLTYTMSGASNGSGSGNGSGNLFNVGVTTVTVTATNACGSSSCSFTVTVEDTESPVITCPANIQTTTDAGTCAATVVTPNPVATDNCAVTEQTWTLSGATTGSSPLTGINNVGTAVFNKGTTTVTYTIKDAAGHSVTCSYTVTVRDLEVPVITCSPNITVTTPTGTCVAEVAYTITATDNCPTVTTQLVSGPASGSAFPIGTTTVTWRAIDDAGNISANCSFTVTVLDGQLPVISAQAANRTVCAGSNATFSVTATNVVTYQWQQWNGTAWVNINGATNSSYTVSNVNTSMNGNTFRVVLNGLCTVVNSNAATLFVNPLPTILLAANTRTSLLPAQSTSIVATVSPTGGSFVWRKNGGIVNGVTGATLSPLTVDNIGTYNTTYTDLNGCVVTSPDIVISGTPAEKIWVYPNPNKGIFQVRYYNNFGEPAKVVVFNAAGQLVFSKDYAIGEPYSRMDVNIANQPAGIYIVKVISGNGKELAAKRIIVAH